MKLSAPWVEKLECSGEYSGEDANEEMNHPNHPTRRELLRAAIAAGACSLLGCAKTGSPGAAPTAIAPAATHPVTTATAATAPWPGPIIDIHQHTTYSGRPDDALLHHQKRMGITKTILLPSGSPVDSPATLKGKANGLYAGAGTIQTVIPVVQSHPGEYFFFANEVPDLPGARQTIETWLKRGALGIGEQKFNLPCDSKEMEMIYELCQEYRVPVLMHFQYEMFNTGYERFGAVLKKWPKVTFVGHALAFWAAIDANANPKVGYPKGKVTPGGLTDRYLSDFPNLYADMSAFSGLNALIRDEDHARGFIQRHQDQMMFGSDCADRAGFGPTCTGASTIAAIQRLAPSHTVANKLLYENAHRMFGI
jgi:predicted TIM-barrel fold metal-dependent hydrolase